MKRGNKKVEQVSISGDLCEDYDTSLSPSEIEAVIKKHFKKVKKSDDSPFFFIGEYNSKEYAIRCKNVTYLGNPHPAYKKRIQIAGDLFKFYHKARSLNREPILLGIYTYQDNTIFVNFNLETYINKSAHNSSAHIYTEDLVSATINGYFEKTDYFGNKITAFRPDVTNVFLEELLCKSEKQPSFILEVEEKNTEKMTSRLLSYQKILSEKVVPEIKSFFLQESKKWYGIDCYKEMINAQYKNKYQPEWVGFYLEYRFEKYLTANDLFGVIQYYQDKSLGGIDLDLYFPLLNSYGDLKAHSEESRGIQGNDWETVFSIINGQKPEDHIYYIVCEHATEKDDKYDYEVTRFWNKSQNKNNLLSYHKRMKNNVRLKKAYILDINYNNRQYLTMFKQGINSNGKPRPPKIMIEHDNLKHFIIEELSL